MLACTIREILLKVGAAVVECQGEGVRSGVVNTMTVFRDTQNKGVAYENY